MHLVTGYSKSKFHLLPSFLPPKRFQDPSFSTVTVLFCFVLFFILGCSVRTCLDKISLGNVFSYIHGTLKWCLKCPSASWLVMLDLENWVGLIWSLRLSRPPGPGTTNILQVRLRSPSSLWWYPSKQCFWKHLRKSSETCPLSKHLWAMAPHMMFFFLLLNNFIFYQP